MLNTLACLAWNEAHTNTHAFWRQVFLGSFRFHGFSLCVCVCTIVISHDRNVFHSGLRFVVYTHSTKADIPKRTPTTQSHYLLKRRTDVKTMSILVVRRNTVKHRRTFFGYRSHISLRRIRSHSCSFHLAFIPRYSSYNRLYIWAIWGPVSCDMILSTVDPFLRLACSHYALSYTDSTGNTKR